MPQIQLDIRLMATGHLDYHEYITSPPEAASVVAAHCISQLNGSWRRGDHRHQRNIARCPFPRQAKMSCDLTGAPPACSPRSYRYTTVRHLPATIYSLSTSLLERHGDQRGIGLGTGRMSRRVVHTRREPTISLL